MRIPTQELIVSFLFLGTAFGNEGRRPPHLVGNGNESGRDQGQSQNHPTVGRPRPRPGGSNPRVGQAQVPRPKHLVPRPRTRKAGPPRIPRPKTRVIAQSSSSSAPTAVFVSSSSATTPTDGPIFPVGTLAQSSLSGPVPSSSSSPSSSGASGPAPSVPGSPAPPASGLITTDDDFKSPAVIKATQGDQFLSGLANEQSQALNGILEAQRRGKSCPSVWFDISRELTQMFRSGNQCNTAARTAIRTALHDCIPWKPSDKTGGCDGSLFLAGEFRRDENAGVDRSAVKFGEMAQRFQVGVGDMLQFAAAHAVVTCPLGPRIRTFVGRVDSSRPEPEGRIPKVFDSTDKLIGIFQERGFSPFELSALLGAHSTSRQFFLDPSKRGAPQDTTPGIWDTAFYGETLNGTAPFIFDSDVRLSRDPRTGPSFRSFVENQRGWNTAFAAAMSKLALLGVRGGENGLIECTNALPAETNKIRDLSEDGEDDDDDDE